MAHIQERRADDGAISYRVQVRLKGFPAQTATFTRKTDAKRWAQQTESAIREGRHFRGVEAKKKTVRDLIDRYIEVVLPTKPKSFAKQRSQLLWWRRELGPRVLADVTPALIAEARDKLVAGVTRRGKARAPATVVRYLAALSHAFSIAVKEWGWLDVNPVQRITKPQEPRGRVRFLSDSEREALLAACRDSELSELYSVVVIALSAGMRLGEILALVWGDVDLTRGRIVLHETKNGERRVVPLVGHALNVLREHARVQRIDTDLVFPGARKEQGPQKPISIRGPWRRAVAAAGLLDFRFHDLRHTAASYLAMNGASAAEIAEVLGHKTLQMVKRYAHLSEAHTHGVVAAMNHKIFGGRDVAEAGNEGRF